MENNLYDITENKYQTRYYYKKGTKILHRINGPAVIHKDGGKEYWVNGKPHKIGGPALDLASSKFFYFNGQLHSITGPAAFRENKEPEYWLNGRYATPDETALIKTIASNSAQGKP